MCQNRVMGGGPVGWSMFSQPRVYYSMCLPTPTYGSSAVYISTHELPLPGVPHTWFHQVDRELLSAWSPVCVLFDFPWCACLKNPLVSWISLSPPHTKPSSSQSNCQVPSSTLSILQTFFHKTILKIGRCSCFSDFKDKAWRG